MSLTSLLKYLCKEPLLHFFLISVALFILYDVNNTSKDNSEPSNIVVSEAELEKYIQYRRRAFSPDGSRSELAKLSEAELPKLIDNYVREQALYQEAISLGLDQEDYLIKQRLIQKVEYLLEGFIESEVIITQLDADQYYRSHLASYTEPERISFSHIYFDAHEKSLLEVNERVSNVLRHLNDNQLVPAQAGDKGDRFLYFKNYADKKRSVVESQFGKAFSDKLFKIEEIKAWSGPIRSEHGEHIVWVSKKQAQRILPQEDVYDRVKDDLRAELVNTALSKKIQDIIRQYSITQPYLENRRPMVK